MAFQILIIFLEKVGPGQQLRGQGVACLLAFERPHHLNLGWGRRRSLPAILTALCAAEAALGAGTPCLGLSARSPAGVSPALPRPASCPRSRGIVVGFTDGHDELLRLQVGGGQL